MQRGRIKGIHVSLCEREIGENFIAYSEQVGMGKSNQVCGERQLDLGGTLRVVWKSSELEISWNV